MSQELSESAVRDLMQDICLTLQRYGVRYVTVGALMRLLGVPDERACKHDTEIMDIESEIHGNDYDQVDELPPPGTILH
jgi:hypothetical protein